MAYPGKQRQLAIFIVVLCSLFLTSGCQAGDVIRPFASDGCSGFPDGTPRQQVLWRRCCVTHDVAYWMGGTYQQRVEADEQLKMCVEEVGEPEIAQLMLAGVRVGGTPYLPTSFRWGYGWPYPRGYKQRTAEQNELLKQILKNN